MTNSISYRCTVTILPHRFKLKVHERMKQHPITIFNIRVFDPIDQFCRLSRMLYAVHCPAKKPDIIIIHVAMPFLGIRRVA